MDMATMMAGTPAAETHVHVSDAEKVQAKKLSQ